MGNLVFQATLGGQVNLVGPNTASTLNINVPAFAGTMASLASVTNNGVAYVNSSGQPTSGSALAFDGSNLGIGTASPATQLHLSSATPPVMRLQTDTTSSAYGVNWYYTSSASVKGAMTLNLGTAEMRMSAGESGNSYFQTFYTNGSERMRLDASGNLGLGATPSAWGGSRYKVIESAYAGALAFDQGYLTASLSTNTYWNGTNWIYKLSSWGATRYELGDLTGSAPSHKWFTAASGTAGNAITFTQAMTLDSSGQLYIGTNGVNTPSSTRTGTAWGFGSGSNNYWINAVNSTGTANHWSFVNGNGEVGKITTSGSATTYATSSDYRLKENIAPMTGALATVAQLKPCTYTWKVDGAIGQGFIAHELQSVVPDAVIGEKDATRVEQYEISPAVPATFDEEGSELTPAVEAVMGEREVPVYQGIDTSFLVATLTAAIQEQQAIITQLQADVEALKAPK